MNDINNIIKKSYKNLENIQTNSYIFEYKFDLIVSIIIILIFIIIIIIIYFYNSINNLSKNKYNLLNNKCNPINIPFMDILNYNNKTSFLDKSTANFNYCVQNALKPVVENTIKPHNESLNTIRKTYDELNTSTNGITSIFNDVRNNVTDITNDIYNRIETTTQEEDTLLTNHKNTLDKSNDKTNDTFHISQKLNRTLIKLSETFSPLKIMKLPSWIKN